MSQPLNSPLSSIGHQDISPPASCPSLVHQYCYTSCRDGQRIIHDGTEKKVRFHRLSFSIKEEKGRMTLLARKRVVKSQLTMFLIPLWSDVLARAIQNTKYKIQYKNTDVLARAGQYRLRSSHQIVASSCRTTSPPTKCIRSS